MIDALVSIIAPHYCCGCGKTGNLLCNDCKYNITSDPYSQCVVCGCVAEIDNLCLQCKVPFVRAWVVGERKGVLRRLIGMYKFERCKSAYIDLGDLILDTLPDLPKDCVIVPIPTASLHIRERGYDHTLLIAKKISKKRGLKCQKVLYRLNNAKQRHKSAIERAAQAKAAFAVKPNIKTNVTYLVIDDVYTTGATLKSACQKLHQSGVKSIYVAVIARQTLD